MDNGTRLFSNNHVWVKVDCESVKIGISNYAQKKLGSILFLSLPDVEETLEIGKKFADIESMKTVYDIISPVDGEVISVNEDIIDNTENINLEPYESWFVEVKASKLSETLMNETDYLKYIEAEG